MTESQFKYGGLTVDELRSLAASPQVGAMEAMPRAFRNLAEHVGEVADLLSRAQADLPNWWKGPAAEQAAASLGRAVAEAREFHESALGAATAVSRCAQVVAEQQHQMMNVPDVTEPAVTDTIVRPATPMEALELARKDAAYQAAREQAVQVVNGIAAQYVETRGQLAAIGIARGEGFEPASGSQQVMHANSPLAIYQQSLAANSTVENRQPRTSRSTFEHVESSVEPANAIALVNHRATPTRVERYPFDESKSFAPSEILLKTQYHPNQHQLFPRSGELAGAPSRNMQLEALRDSGAPEREASSVAWEYENPQEVNPPRIKYSFEVDPESSTKLQHRNAPTTSRTSRRIPARDYSTLHPKGFESRDPIPIESAPRVSGGTPHNFIEHSDATNPTMLPPVGSVGTIHREQDNHNPRPAYLKERKSEWLPDTIAAPPDGILTPDWFDQA
ncbi:MAG: hypothetical protein JF587_20445 [Catenulisporales bacterium]|nr:hypothetical protein [Catenulisporales bacterium]